MAKELGISPSYLNLIEHDRRAVSATLLIRLAQRFEVDLKQLSSDGDAQLLGELMETFGDPLFENLDVVTSEVREMAGVAPTACRAVAQLYRAYRHVRDSAESLAARLSEDLALPGVDRSRLPTEEVSTFIQAQRNHFPELEQAADDLRRRAELEPDDLFHGMVRFLDRELDVRTRVVTAGEEAGAVRRYDPARRQLTLSESLPLSSRTFQLAHQIGLLSQADLLRQQADDPGLTTDESRALCRVILANYFAGAVLMPYEAIRQAAKDERHDIELLQNRFGTTFEMVCHRLTTLQRPGAEGIPLHFVRVDIAGNVSKWFSASGIPIARHGGACPRWNLHTAFLTPGRISVQLQRTIDGQVYFSIARTISRASRGYHVPRAVQAITIGCAVELADRMVYADSVDLNNLEAAVPIGPTCRLCHQPDCDQRVLPPIEQPLRIHENERGHSFYNNAGSRNGRR
jgi:predicted transcriptional regulator/transcriptional regulator with XRE-family HTH domain